MSISIEEYISTLIQEQFPEFYKEEGMDYIQFVKAYFEWMEEESNPIYDTRRLADYSDIDDTLDKFIIDFQKKYMANLPSEILGDKRFLQKHILDLYRSKGSLEGAKLLFRLLYNEEIDVYIPSYDMLRASDGKWIEPKYLEVSYNVFNPMFENQIVTGTTSNATAFVEYFEQRIVNNKTIYLMFLSNIQGAFMTGEKITYSGLGLENAPKIVGSPCTFTINTSDEEFSIGEYVTPASANGSGEGFKAIVDDVRDSTDATIEFLLVSGGNGYSNAASISIVAGSNTTGTGADFVVGSLINTETYELNNDIIDDIDTLQLDAVSYGLSGNASANVSSTLEDAIGFTSHTVGTIGSIITTNPGTNYNGSVSVTITDPYTSGQLIPDGIGGFWGTNANVTGTAIFGQGVATSVRVVDSGMGYHTDGESLLMQSTANSALSLTGTVTMDGYGKSEGFWRGTDSFLSFDKYLQDNYFYQEYSYQIKSSRTLDKFKNVMLRTMHPVGNEMFGSAVVSYLDDDPISVAEDEIIKVYHDLFPTLAENTNIFGDHILTPEVRTLTSTLFADADIFGTQVLSTTYDLGPAILVNTSTFGTHDMDWDQPLQPEVFTNTSTFGAHTIIFDQILSPTIVDGPPPDTFYNPVISQS